VIADQRLWRTRDGGLVNDGDPAAVTLAYAPGDELTDTDVGLLAEPAQSKQAARPPDKRRRTAPPNKAAG